MGALLLIFAPELGFEFKYISLSLVPSNLVFLAIYLWMEYLRRCSDEYYKNEKKLERQYYNFEDKELLSSLDDEKSEEN